MKPVLEGDVIGREELSALAPVLTQFASVLDVEREHSLKVWELAGEMARVFLAELGDEQWRDL